MSTEPDTAATGAVTDGNPGTPAPPAPQKAADLGALQSALDQAAATGQTQALQPLLTAAGVDSPEGLQEFVTAARKRALDDLNDQQRMQAQLEQATAQATAAQAAARQAMIRSALVLAGMPAERVDRRIALVEVADGADQAAVDQAVAALQEADPELFAAPATQTPAPPHSVGARPAQQGSNVTPFDAGRERARKAKESATGATREDLIRQFSNPSSPLAPIA